MKFSALKLIIKIRVRKHKRPGVVVSKHSKSQSLGGRGRKILGACWLTDLIEFMRSRFCERPSAKQKLTWKSNRGRNAGL